MKALIWMLAFLVGGLSSGYSQTRPQKQKRTAEERATIMTEALTRRLSLAADQKAQVYDLYLDHAKKMDNMRLEASAEKKARMEKHQEMMADHDKKLEKILNADQLKKYQEYRSNVRARMQKHPQHHQDGRMHKKRN